MSKRTTGTWSAVERVELVEKFITSGLRQKEFCRQHNVGLSTLQLWLRNYRRGHGVGAGTHVKETARQPFTPVTFKQPKSAQAAAPISIEFPNHVIVHLTGPVDSGLLIQLIQSGGA